MNTIQNSRLLFLLSLIATLPGCTTSVKISLVEIAEAEIHSEHFRPIATQEISDPIQDVSSAAIDEVILVVLESDTDLESVVRQREFAFLYFDLRSCGDDKTFSEIYSAPVYVDRRNTSTEPNGYIYYALLPQSYEQAIERYLQMRGASNRDVPNDICIELGAGNMAGQKLSTNSVPIQIDSRRKSKPE